MAIIVKCQPGWGLSPGCRSEDEERKANEVLTFAVHSEASQRTITVYPWLWRKTGILASHPAVPISERNCEAGEADLCVAGYRE